MLLNFCGIECIRQVITHLSHYSLYIFPVSGNESFPVYLCISAAELKPYLDSGVVADKKRDDLVFLSDGYNVGILTATLKGRLLEIL